MSAATDRASLCSCLWYGHGMLLTRVIGAHCPVHGQNTAAPPPSPRAAGDPE